MEEGKESYLTLRKLWLFSQHTWPHPLFSCVFSRFFHEEIVQPGGESIIPMPRRSKSGATRPRIQWVKIKIRVPLRSARSHPLSASFLFWVFPIQKKERRKNSTIFFLPTGLRRGGREERGEKRERDGTLARTHTHTQPKAPRKRERDGGVEVVGDGGVEGG